MKKMIIALCAAVCICSSCSSSFDTEVEETQESISSKNAKNSVITSAADDEEDWVCEDASLLGKWQSEKIFYVDGPHSGVKNALKVNTYCNIKFNDEGWMDIEASHIVSINENVVNDDADLDFCLGQEQYNMHRELHCQYDWNAPVINNNYMGLRFGSFTQMAIVVGNDGKAKLENYSPEENVYRMHAERLIVKKTFEYFKDMTIGYTFTRVIEDTTTGINQVTL